MRKPESNQQTTQTTGLLSALTIKGHVHQVSTRASHLLLLSTTEHCQCKLCMASGKNHKHSRMHTSENCRGQRQETSRGGMETWSLGRMGTSRWISPFLYSCCSSCRSMSATLQAPGLQPSWQAFSSSELRALNSCSPSMHCRMSQYTTA